MFILINACAQGLTELDKIANHIYLRSMTLRYYLTQDSAQENPSLVRMVIFVIRDGAALATAADIFDSSQYLTASYDANTGTRFKILHDELIVLNSTGVEEMQPGYVKLSLGFPQRFNATTSGIANCTQNAMQLMLISNQAANGPDFI